MNVELINEARWLVKFRLASGMLLSKDKSGREIEVFKNKYLNKRLEYANRLANNFRSHFDIAHIYGVDSQGNDIGEIARFDKSSRTFVFN
jgi:hypothetical protein